MVQKCSQCFILPIPILREKRPRNSLSKIRGRTAMSDKRVETLGSKIRFSAFWKHSPPPPPFLKTMLIFLLLRLQRLQRLQTYTTLNWGAGDIRDLTLDANKIEQMLKYRKSSFPKCLSTTVVAHCGYHV